MPENLIEELERFNPWWEGKIPNLPTPLVKREMFDTIMESLSRYRIQTINGLRQVGKTTLVYHLIDRLLKEIPPDRILYYSFDLPIGENPIRSVMETYLTEVLRAPLMELNKAIYIFLDEVHKLPGWSSEVKYYTDLQPHLHFVITGSSTMHLTRGAGESLIGRTALRRLYPFSFREFLDYHGVESPPIFDLFSLLSEPRIPEFRSSEKLRIEFLRYSELGGLPGIYTITDPLERTEEIKARIDLTLFRDILEIFDIRQPGKLSSLFHFIVSNSAQAVNYTTLSSALKIKFETLKHYLEYLELSHLVHLIRLYTPNPLKSISKNPKIYVSDHAFFLLNGCPKGRIMETIALTHLYRLTNRHLLSFPYYWVDPRGQEVDMVVKTKNGILPIEIKYRKSISKSDLNGLKAFSRSTGSSTAFLITEKDTGVLEVDTRTGPLQIIQIPLWKFLLSS